MYDDYTWLLRILSPFVIPMTWIFQSIIKRGNLAWRGTILLLFVLIFLLIFQFAAIFTFEINI